MSDEPQVRVHPHGLEGEHDQRPAVVVTHRGCRLVLRFSPGDFAGEGLVQELCLRPGEEELTPRVLRRFAPQAELYTAYARHAMRILKPGEGRHENFQRASEALRDIAGPGRGLPDRFYETIAENYKALVAEGERHPVKAIAEIHHVTISGASRWVTECRDRDLLPKKTKKETKL